MRPAALIATIIATAGPTLAQLDPPSGSVGPSFKNLDQVEPRIPLTQETTPGDDYTVFIITEPGSYYLTADTDTETKSGIQIATGDVTIDLMGYNLRGSGNGLGIYTFGGSFDRITVRNGTVTGFSRAGIDLLRGGYDGAGYLVESIHAAHNDEGGIRVGKASIVRNCIALANGATGISGDGTFEACIARLNAGAGISAGPGAVIRGCLAEENDSWGIYADYGATITGCRAVGNGTLGIRAGASSIITGCSARGNLDDGISTGQGATVSQCTSRANEGDGFALGAGCTITFCTAYDNTVDGIHIIGDSLVLNNTCNRNGWGGDGAGIHALAGGGGNRIEGNLVCDADRGLRIATTGNFIVRNTAQGNTINYDIVANNKVGPIAASPNSDAIYGSMGGAGVGTANPWANFSF